MTLSISQIGTVFSEYTSYKNSLSNGLASLNAVIAAGTVLYNDTKFSTQYPTNWAAYQTYLMSVQTAINSFIAAFPVEPPLSS